MKEVYESKTAIFIIEKTPYLSKYTNKTVEVYNDLYSVIENKENKSNAKVNEEAMDVMLKHEIITKESAKKLIERNKVYIEDDSFLNKY